MALSDNNMSLKNLYINLYINPMKAWITEYLFSKEINLPQVRLDANRVSKTARPGETVTLELNGEFFTKVDGVTILGKGVEMQTPQITLGGKAKIVITVKVKEDAPSGKVNLVFYRKGRIIFKLNNFLSILPKESARPPVPIITLPATLPAPATVEIEPTEIPQPAPSAPEPPKKPPPTPPPKGICEGKGLSAEKVQRCNSDCGTYSEARNRANCINMYVEGIR